MSILRFHRYDLLVSLGCVALLASFAWYAQLGPRGYAYRAELEKEIATLQVDNSVLTAEKLGLERQVQLMRPEHIDRDMLEELARTQLKMLQPNAVIVSQK
jgi:cell division protein FtsB